MPPTLTNGKICYIEFLATDIARSADFYRRVFGWNIRKRGMVIRPLMTRLAK
jgi:predicted enzyme related to lactoylglutathione lyase